MLILSSEQLSNRKQRRITGGRHGAHRVGSAPRKSDRVAGAVQTLQRRDAPICGKLANKLAGDFSGVQRCVPKFEIPKANAYRIWHRTMVSLSGKRMSHKTIQFALIIFLALCAGNVMHAALAAPAERPETKVGDRWNFACLQGAQGATNRLWVVTAVDPTGIKATENGQLLLLTLDLNELESPRRKDSDRKLLSFPLEVGKHWEASDQYVVAGGAKSSRHLTGEGKGYLNVSVVSFEKVRVPAGEFDAFKLTLNSTFQDSGGVHTETLDATYYYAPAAHAIVKSDSISHPIGAEVSCELKEFQLQP